MSGRFALAAMSLCLAGPALAQSAPPAVEAAPVASTPPAAPAKAGTTVSGVTVTPSPRPKSCSSRDKDCIALVVAELKERYPEELKKFCFGRQAQAVRTQFTNEQLLESLGGNDPPVGTAFGVNSALKAACASDKK